MQHSIDQFYEKILKTNSQNLKILQAITESLVSDKDVVTVKLEDEKGNTIDYRLPSYAYMLRRVSEINNNVELLNSINQKTADGKVTLTNEPDKITAIKFPINFSAEENWFLKNFLSENLTVKIDLTGKVDNFSKYCYYSRLNLDISTEVDKTTWADYFQGRNNLDYYTIKEFLNSRNISFTEEVKQELLPALELQYSGTFDVIGILPDVLKTAEYASIKKYKFNKITYTENGSGTKQGHQLVAGDLLTTKNSKASYIVYNVEYIDNEYIVTLAMKNGFETVSVGINMLRIVSDTIGSKFIEIPVNYNQHTILFVKPIDPEYHITTDDWSEGVAFDSASLTKTDSNGNTISFKDYFIKNIYDVEKVLLDHIEYNSIPAYEGITPDAPVLNASNFVVMQDNNVQKRSIKTDAIDFAAKEISRLRLENKTIQQSIIALDISRSQEGMTPTVLDQINLHTIELSQQLEANNLQIKTLSEQIASSKYEYNSKAETVTPSYAVKGFWNIPQRKKDAKGRFQDVIGFNVQYRYLDLFDNPACNVKIKFEELDGEVRDALFSEWKELKTNIREKIWDQTIGDYVWEFQDLEKNVPNVNQVEVPISPYEKVEIRVKSISEAGYPSNPLTSGWSKSILVEFPDVILVSETNTLDVIMEESLRSDIDAKLAQIDILQSNINAGLFSQINIKRINLTQTNIDNKTIVFPNQIDVDTFMLFDEDEGILLQKESAWNLESDLITVSFSDEQMTKFVVGSPLVAQYKIKI